MGSGRVAATTCCYSEEPVLDSACVAALLERPPELSGPVGFYRPCLYRGHSFYFVRAVPMFVPIGFLQKQLCFIATAVILKCFLEAKRTIFCDVCPSILSMDYIRRRLRPIQRW